MFERIRRLKNMWHVGNIFVRPRANLVSNYCNEGKRINFLEVTIQSNNV